MRVKKPNVDGPRKKVCTYQGLEKGFFLKKCCCWAMEKTDFCKRKGGRRVKTYIRGKALNRERREQVKNYPVAKEMQKIVGLKIERMEDK